jgi:hypothetical protein
MKRRIAVKRAALRANPARNRIAQSGGRYPEEDWGGGITAGLSPAVVAFDSEKQVEKVVKAEKKKAVGDARLASFNISSHPGI